ncbi:hypothetical protein BN946_scf184978.g20 [Trametes cinnabarina]|uniref:Cyclin-dependent kinase 8 n=1 Tax=Pycnoporus cinnabarinus TaxID=5643 RepID=A0A060SRP1_PYCCI|nr:hypothetical protein BN946_scf184978.g20 [Trametes cinnabarina]
MPSSRPPSRLHSELTISSVAPSYLRPVSYGVSVSNLTLTSVSRYKRTVGRVRISIPSPAVRRGPSPDIDPDIQLHTDTDTNTDPDPNTYPNTTTMDDWSSGNILLTDPMRIYRAKRDAARKRVTDKYAILGFISSGTYGRVYKAQSKDPDGRIHAIKKFKPDKEGDVVTYTGISQSAIREIAVSTPSSPTPRPPRSLTSSQKLNREISHENIVALKEVILEDKSIYMVFEYAEHDFLQVIHHHSQTLRSSISQPVLKSLTYQLLNGLLYLHQAHIIHRDLKPANILITSSGLVKIGDLGLARLTHQPLQPLCAGDKVVVTIWYRAPELLLGAKHYNKAIDIWAVGCVIAELASLRPIFKGDEAKLDQKKNVPFQKDQLLKIFEVLGTPSGTSLPASSPPMLPLLTLAPAERDWPKIKEMPEYASMKKLDHYTNRLSEWCQSRIRSHGADLLAHLFAYDPDKRLTAAEALQHRWFQEEPRPTRNAFASLPAHQIPPHRRITQDDAPSMMPVPAVGSQVQPQVSQVQATAQAHLSQLSHSHSNASKVGSAASFASLSGAGARTRGRRRG